VFVCIFAADLCCAAVAAAASGLGSTSASVFTVQSVVHARQGKSTLLTGGGEKAINIRRKKARRTL